MQKLQKYHHSITENGNLQLRIVTEYIKNGKILDKKYSGAYTPLDTKDMPDWDARSKDIVLAITDKQAVADSDIEFWVMNGEPNPLETITGIVTYDRVIEEDGKIAVRKITRIYDEGKEVSKKYHRSWVMPGDDLSKVDVISKAVAEKLHTPGVISAYKAKMESIDELTTAKPGSY